MPISQRKTPGVYVTELDGFPPSVVGVETAVPLFVGYTETANGSGTSLLHTAQKVRSSAEFTAIYGGTARPEFTLRKASQTDCDLQLSDASGTPRYYDVVRIGPALPILATAMRLFYDNGGGDCYVVSVGDFVQAQQGIDVEKLIGGLDVGGRVDGPTLLAVPDGVLLDSAAEFQTLVQAMLAQCGTLQDRFAILDIFGTEKIDPDSAVLARDMSELIETFRTQAGDDYLSYGASYFPFLATSCVARDDVDFQMFENAPLRDVLAGQAAVLYEGARLDYVTALIARTAEANLTLVEVTALDQDLCAALPAMTELETVVAARMGQLPPSAAIAGVYAAGDRDVGVWKAPGNAALASVNAPTLAISDAMQEDMNVPPGGKAVDAIRNFPGRGTVVWGARTLDGNSSDWRYISVRRTAIYIEQSLKAAFAQLVFAPNDAATWSTAVSMAADFLRGLWAGGGLAGSTAGQAYNVQCGLGATMTAQDILEGQMIVQVTIAPLRPAEFIVLSFRQQMQTG